MLVLSRRVGEQIRINADIVITVVEIDRGKVKLAFTAPESVTIHRKEVYDRIINADRKPDSPVSKTN
jgi:carbon storage regulator